MGNIYILYLLFDRVVRSSSGGASIQKICSFPKVAADAENLNSSQLRRPSNSPPMDPNVSS
jgi:hypothetical protein